MWERPRRLVLTGVIDQHSVAELRDQCSRLADGGRRRVVVDASAVSRCDRDGLSGLRELQDGCSGLNVDPVAFRWGQFLALLQATPLDELNAVHADIRVLRGESALGADTSRRAAPPRAAGRHARPATGSSGPDAVVADPAVRRDPATPPRHSWP